MRNRWLIALAAIGLHISIDSVYAWSVLTRPIMVDTGFTLSQTTWTFSPVTVEASLVCQHILQTFMVYANSLPFTAVS